MSKKPRFRTPFESQHAKTSKALLIFLRLLFSHIFHLLVISKILGLSINTFTIDGKYSLRNREKLL